jgi:Flp pilus assembly protein TadG
MVEAAIMLPLIILLIFGLVEFSRAYNAKVTVTHAAREGVRVLSITGDPDAAAVAAENAATSLDPAQMVITTTACVPEEPTELTVTYPYSYEIPFFGSRSATFSSTGVMRCSG